MTLRLLTTFCFEHTRITSCPSNSMNSVIMTTYSYPFILFSFLFFVSHPVWSIKRLSQERGLQSLTRTAGSAPRCGRCTRPRAAPWPSTWAPRWSFKRRFAKIITEKAPTWPPNHVVSRYELGHRHKDLQSMLNKPSLMTFGCASQYHISSWVNSCLA